MKLNFQWDLYLRLFLSLHTIFKMMCQVLFNSSPPAQNGCQFRDNIFKCIFLNEKFCSLIWISLKFVRKGPIDNKWVLVQVMAWCRLGGKPLSKPIRDPFHWCIYAALGGDELTHSAWIWHHRSVLTHWGRATHICVGKLTIIGSDNGLSPGRRQATIWTSTGILLSGPLGTNFSQIVIEI